MRIREMFFVAGFLLVATGCGSDGADDAATTAAPNTTALPAADSTAAPNTTALPAAALPESLSIMAPADPGGGWDGTARAMQTALDPLLDGSVDVYNVPGAGGTVGLAQFKDSSGSGSDLMVMGSVMVGAILTNDSPVTLEDVTPIASLTTEYLAIVVPASSPFQTIDDLIAAFVADPTAVSWAGGSAGGTDHQLVALIAKNQGVPAGSINFIAHSGGGEALASLLSGAVSAGVSGLSEFRDQVDAGALRLLAVSSSERIDGADVPTLIESGIDVELSNWRGVVAPAEISDADRMALLAAIEQMTATDEWVAELEAKGWTSFYQSGDEFAAFLGEYSETVKVVLAEIGLL
ncbi:MAG: tripartite tricarboxylate transporter substrate-binding protein [Actinomycetota bacterium]|nr:tripartite tricarboxylate transporter substrate-binding protein [Actinomycetota bacterium]